MIDTALTPRRHVILAALFGFVACAAPELDDGVKEVLTKALEAELSSRSLTGTWTNAAGDRLLLVQAGAAVVTLPLGALRDDHHFAEGALASGQLAIVGYRQGVASQSSVGAFEVGPVRAATLDVAAGTLTFASGDRWSRRESVPGTGRLTGVWSGSDGDVAIAHEGDYLVACATDAAARARWTSAYAWVDGNGLIRMLRIHEGRVCQREIGQPGADGATIQWQGGRRWQFEGPLVGAPPAPPTLLTPVARAKLPNVVDGKLAWRFDWTDVPGATEYRIEIQLDGAAQPLVAREGVVVSAYQHSMAGGFLRADRGSWRVAAKVGRVWTEWSARSRFGIERP